MLLAGLVVALRIDSGQLESSSSPRYSAVTAPELEVALHQGRLSITTHTASRAHERRLETNAGNWANVLSLDFRPLGTAPRNWPQATERLLHTLAIAQSVTARLRNGALQIRAVVTDQDEWHKRMQRLREVLPPSPQDDIRLTSLNAAVGVEQLCATAFAGFRPGPINFEESVAQFRSSAYPALDRIVVLADACRSARITVIGHTDASGDEALNRQLSLARAQAVADYLSEHGIAADRLAIEGLGSASPVADNGTRYGRSLNRRIEIDWRIAADAS